MRGLSAVSTVSGIDALALVVEFARQLPSAQFSFVRYKPSLSVENRVLGIAPVKLEALPAADLVNLVRHRPDVVSELLRHDPVAEDAQTTRLFARDILSGALEELRRSLHVDEALGVRSECRFPDGEVLHLQLMDFRVEPSAEALAGLVAAIQKAVPSGGLILESLHRAPVACRVRRLTSDGKYPQAHGTSRRDDGVKLRCRGSKTCVSTRLGTREGSLSSTVQHHRVLGVLPVSVLDDPRNLLVQAMAGPGGTIDNSGLSRGDGRNP